jgi:hypothetical protein
VPVAGPSVTFVEDGVVIFMTQVFFWVSFAAFVWAGVKFCLMVLRQLWAWFTWFNLLVLRPTAWLSGGLLRYFRRVRGEIPTDVEGVANLEVTHLARCRLRARSGWVNALQALLDGEVGIVGALFRGRWRPDLPSDQLSTVAACLLSLTEDGVILLGGGVLPTNVDGVAGFEPYLHVQLPTGEQLTCFPSLVAKLSCFSLCRRDTGLLTGLLRVKALEWCRDAGLSWPGFSFGHAGSLRLAMEESCGARLLASRTEASFSLEALA